MAVDVSKFASLMNAQPQQGRRAVLQNCTIDELAIDPSYQRDINLQGVTLIRSIATHWDWSLCHPLIVSERPDGSLFVVDGQHRLMAAALRGDIRDLPCVVIRYPTVEAEAKGFVALNTARRPLTPFAIFRAALAAGDEDAIGLNAMIARHGLRITSSQNRDKWKAGDLANIGQLRSRFASSPELLDRALGIFAKSWPDIPLIYHQLLLTAIHRLLGDYAVEDEVLVSRLSAIDEDSLIRSIRREQAQSGLGTQSAAVAVLNSLIRPITRPTTCVAPPPPPAPAKRPLTFEEQLAKVAAGAPLVPVVRLPSRVIDPALGSRGEANC